MGKRRANDPLQMVPDPIAVREALEDARRRVASLEFLLDVSEGVEKRMHGDHVGDARNDSREACPT
jgi:hypothetical protein